eukprot:NP_498200.1 RBR-type E3 ubiquitin transferase [Caenorhabditis elegans]
MSDDSRETQLFELEALESVLRENKLTRISDWADKNAEIRGIIEVGFDTLSDPKVTIEGTSDSSDHFSIPLDILPPIRLKFHLPNDYPSVSSPKLELESYWMNQEQMTSCETELARICEENQMMEVLFMCYQTIIDSIDQSHLKIINLNEACALKNNGETIESLKKKILGKGEEAAEEHFVNTLFDCEVCYDSQMGQHCIKFQPCSHVFCKQCTFDYYRTISKGVVSKAMQCLAEGCKSEAQQNTVKEALGDDLYAKQRFLAECSYCNFSFCNLCKQTFHGIERCKWKKGDKELLVKRWKDGDEAEKAEMCRQFGGEKRVEELVERFLNEEWLDSNSKPCPKCSVSIEKNEGCHKMHCTKCDTYFCWLCSETLDKEDPYKHFQGDGSCSGRLFEGVHHDLLDNDDDLLFDMAFNDGSDYDSDETVEYPESDEDIDAEDWLEQEGHFDELFFN